MAKKMDEISIIDQLLNMTVNNPIFIFVLLTVFWFLPGIIIRRINADNLKKAKQESQANAIAKLYPKGK